MVVHILPVSYTHLDMNFLSETLMRLGYDGKISYVDTLSLSRSLIKGLHNYRCV